MRKCGQRNVGWQRKKHVSNYVASSTSTVACAIITVKLDKPVHSFISSFLSVVFFIIYWFVSLLVAVWMHAWYDSINNGSFVYSNCNWVWARARAGDPLSACVSTIIVYLSARVLDTEFIGLVCISHMRGCVQFLCAPNTKHKAMHAHRTFSRIIDFNFYFNFQVNRHKAQPIQSVSKRKDSFDFMVVSLSFFRRQWIRNHNDSASLIRFQRFILFHLVSMENVLILCDLLSFNALPCDLLRSGCSIEQCIHAYRFIYFFILPFQIYGRVIKLIFKNKTNDQNNFLWMKTFHGFLNNSLTERRRNGEKERMERFCFCMSRTQIRILNVRRVLILFVNI